MSIDTEFAEVQKTPTLHHVWEFQGNVWLICGLSLAIATWTTTVTQYNLFSLLGFIFCVIAAITARVWWAKTLAIIGILLLAPAIWLLIGWAFQLR